MPLYQLEVAAASAAVNDDLINNAPEQWKPARNVNRGRRIYRAALTGSAAAADTKIRLEVGGKPIAVMYNTSTGNLTTKDEILPIGATVPPNVDFKAVVIDAAATNPVYLLLFMDE